MGKRTKLFAKQAIAICVAVLMVTVVFQGIPSGSSNAIDVSSKQTSVLIGQDSKTSTGGMSSAQTSQNTQSVSGTTPILDSASSTLDSANTTLGASNPLGGSRSLGVTATAAVSGTITFSDDTNFSGGATGTCDNTTDVVTTGDVTIDLAGHNVAMQSIDAVNTNLGRALTITDTVGSGSLTVDASAVAVNAIAVLNDFTVDGVTLTCTSTVDGILVEGNMSVHNKANITSTGSSTDGVGINCFNSTTYAYTNIVVDGESSITASGGSSGVYAYGELSVLGGSFVAGNGENNGNGVVSENGLNLDGYATGTTTSSTLKGTSAGTGFGVEVYGDTTISNNAYLNGTSAQYDGVSISGITLLVIETNAIVEGTGGEIGVQLACNDASGIQVLTGGQVMGNIAPLSTYNPNSGVDINGLLTVDDMGVDFNGITQASTVSGTADVDYVNGVKVSEPATVTNGGLLTGTTTGMQSTGLFLNTIDVSGGGIDGSGNQIQSTVIGTGTVCGVNVVGASQPMLVHGTNLGVTQPTVGISVTSGGKLTGNATTTDNSVVPAQGVNVIAGFLATQADVVVDGANSILTANGGTGTDNIGLQVDVGNINAINSGDIEATGTTNGILATDTSGAGFGNINANSMVLASPVGLGIAVMVGGTIHGTTIPRANAAIVGTAISAGNGGTIHETYNETALTIGAVTPVSPNLQNISNLQNYSWQDPISGTNAVVLPSATTMLSNVNDGNVVLTGTRTGTDPSTGETVLLDTNSTTRQIVDFNANLQGPVAVTHTVKFVSDGADYITPEMINDGGFATAPVSNPTKIGNTFLGWSPSNDPANIVNNATINATAVTADITYTAQWQADPLPSGTTHTVKFVSDGVDYVTPETIDDGAFATAPASNPTKMGNTFLGWSPSNDPANIVDNTTINATAVTADVTYTAQWQMDASKSNTPQTGDNLSVIYVAFGIGITALGITFIVYKKRKI